MTTSDTFYEHPAMNRVWSVGERGFSHYSMKWATVSTEPDEMGWFHVRNDDGTTDLFNAQRFVTPELARRFGYGGDPKGGD